MTRKHFEALAALVADSSSFLSQAEREELARQLATYCQQYNPNFNRTKFLIACARNLFN